MNLKTNTIMKMELKNEHLKHYGTIVISAAGLITALFTSLRDESSDRIQTQELKLNEFDSRLEFLEREQKQIYMELYSVKGYISAGQQHVAQAPQPTPVPSSEPVGPKRYVAPPLPTVAPPIEVLSSEPIWVTEERK